MKQTLIVVATVVAGSLLILASLATIAGARAQGGGAADLINITKSPFDANGNPTATLPKSKVQIRVGCKDSTGRELKPGDLGYEQCTTTSAPVTGGAPQAGTGTKPAMNVHLGD